jgi:Flp pilus assembly protein TadD/energy-coupling factor transporter ATP-binding protein EcfA2
MEAETVLNPFPGLRPFEPDEDYLFFGREKQIDELQRRLRGHRFLSVVGNSGSGKSSLVRSGLIPALQAGFMASAGSSWRIVMFRPGENPIGQLASALDAPDALGAGDALAATNRILIEATLYRGTLGLVDAVRQARIPRHDNVLIVVDQFEELFRFRRSRLIANARDEALAFVKLLLEAARQHEIPIYVVITMRSDFIGDCMEYPGLAEAINSGQYLIPRMTRDELRSAITGPVLVGGGAISPRLVLRLLNDVGEDQDQLPLLQHALMRTWEHGRGTIDIADYEAIGTIRGALSRHAEEAYQESTLAARPEITERLFKALTDTVTDYRGVRRATAVNELAAVCEASEREVIEVAEVFRRPGRSFLMPPASVPLESGSILDLSHESLMRCWTRLIQWAEEENASAVVYMRLSRAAAWFEEGTAGLWRNPELELGLRWKEEHHPTSAWARRYAPNFAGAMHFLERSREERERIDTEAEAQRRKQLRSAWVAAAVLACMVVIVALLGYSAHRATLRAEQNLLLARNAVNIIVSSASRAHARESAEIPEVEELRRRLLSKAQSFYLVFARQSPQSAELRQESALAHSSLGDIHRLLEERADAVREYESAIDGFQRLAHEDPRKPQYRRELAYSLNWLGETLRTWLSDSRGRAPYTRADAERAYGRALSLQRELHGQSPSDPVYQQELARTRYNLGIFRYDGGDLQQCEAEFREAIRLLEPLATRAHEGSDVPPAQDLARAYNDLAVLLSDAGRSGEARRLYGRAIDIEESLDRHQGDRQYKVELATFHNNLSSLLWNGEELEEAKRQNHRALDLIDRLAAPAPPLAEQRAKALMLRGLLRQAQHPEFHASYSRLAEEYLLAARKDLKSGSFDDADDALRAVRELLRELTEPDRARLLAAHDVLQNELVQKKKGAP